MILAAGILSLLILAFCLCVRRHELVYYRISGRDPLGIVYCPRGPHRIPENALSITMEPPEGWHYQITCVWRTLFRWKLSHSCYSMYTVNPPRHFNCRSQVVPVMEKDGKIERWYGPCHPPIGEFILVESGEPVVRIVIDHEKEMEE